MEQDGEEFEQDSDVEQDGEVRDGLTGEDAVAEQVVSGAELDRQQALEDLKTGALLRVGTTMLPLRSILNIKVGELISLDRALAAPVQVIAGGRSVASGELVAVNGCYAVRIDEVAGMERHLPEDGSGY